MAIQTLDTVDYYCKSLAETGQFPLLKTMLCIGGINSKEPLNQIRNGVHIVVATPGRLSDLLNKKKINLDICKYITLDEADRLLDLAFEEEIRNVLDHFSVKIYPFFCKFLIFSENIFLFISNFFLKRVKDKLSYSLRQCPKKSKTLLNPPL